MTQRKVPRRCLTCGQLTTNGTRCALHDRGGAGSTERRGYGAAYQRERAALLTTHPRCYLCDQPATTTDHVPPLRDFPSPEQWHGELKPCCARHNYGWRNR